MINSAPIPDRRTVAEIWQDEREMFGRAVLPVRARSPVPAPERTLIDLSMAPSSMEARAKAWAGAA